MPNLRKASRLAKRIARRIAPSLFKRISAYTNKTIIRVRSSAVSSALGEQQRLFDERLPVDPEALVRLATQTSIVVYDQAPFSDIDAVIAALSDENITLGELVIVDTTAELIWGLPIRQHMARWRFSLPMTKLTRVAYLEQDINPARAFSQGIASSGGDHIWLVSPGVIPLKRAFEYALKAYLSQGCTVSVSSVTMCMDGSVRIPAISHNALTDQVASIDRHARDGAMAVAHTIETRQFKDIPSINQISSSVSGLFGGPRSLFENQLDNSYCTEATLAELALRQHSAGWRLVSTPASMTLRATDSTFGRTEAWALAHDWRWLRAAALQDSATEAGRRADSINERIELVCPFHRGDVLLATQLAVYLLSIGQDVRLHVAKEMLQWVRDFTSHLDVETVPSGMPSAEATYPALLESYAFVSQRQDASRFIARAHPVRSLSDTGQNLFEYMYEQVGLAADTLLPNHKPTCSDEDRRFADALLSPLGRSAVFIHPFGGWELKSIPEALIVELARRVTEAGMVLVQIGGASDKHATVVEHRILENFLPSRWRAILEHGHGLIGVDSWSAHFASILDIRQLTLFGSTHPRHVQTKRFFRQQNNPAFAMGPTVNCSPCNSTKCLAFPSRNFCTGYFVDNETIDAFLSR